MPSHIVIYVLCKGEVKWSDFFHIDRFQEVFFGGASLAILCFVVGLMLAKQALYYFSHVSSPQEIFKLYPF
jgi:hypothetical protein